MSINDIFSDQIGLKKWSFNYLIKIFILDTMKKSLLNFHTLQFIGLRK